jgi:hypothetical protein
MDRFRQEELKATATGFKKYMAKLNNHAQIKTERGRHKSLNAKW